MKLRMLWLAVAGVVGSVSVAGAQSPPPPPPAAPPADSPPPAAAPADPNAPVAPPVDPNAAPAPGTPAAPAPAAPPAPSAPPAAPGTQPGVAPADPAAMQPAPQPAAPPQAAPSLMPMVFPPAAPSGTAAGGEDTTAGETKAKPLFWRESTFTWNQAATTTLLGIGRDNLGHEHEEYGWLFYLRPNFYVLDLAKDKITVAPMIAWQTELTNGDTRYKNETLFQDVRIDAAYRHTLWTSGGADEGEYATGASISGRLIFPTSKKSIAEGVYLRTGIGAGLSQKVKLLGSKAAGLNNITAKFGLSWSHLFSRSYTPTNSEFAQIRQNATGETIRDDQLTGQSFTINKLTGLLDLSLPLYKELKLTTVFGFAANWKHQFPAADILVANDPDAHLEESDAPVYHPSTGFGVELGYTILEVVSLGLGYSNTDILVGAPQTGPDGQRRDMFYNADAQFYFDLTANLDAIYSKVSGRDKKASTKTGSAPAGVSF